MQRFLIIFITITCFAFISMDDYKDGMKAYKRGNIIEALELFITKVIDKPKHKKSVMMIKKLVPEVIKIREEKARKYEASGQWDKAQKQYDRLRRLDRVLQKLIVFENGKKIEFPRINVADAQSTARDRAAEKYYIQGVEAMKTIGNAEQAVNFFKEARKFNPDYKDAKELSAQALYKDGVHAIDAGDFKAGVQILWKTRDFYPDGFKDAEQRIQAAIDSAKVKVAIMPFDNLTSKTKYGDVGANLSSEIIASGVGQKPIFVDFVTRDYVYSLLSEQNFGASGRVDASTAPQIGKLIGIHVFVFGKITAINEFYPKVQKVNGESQKKIYGDPSYYVYAKWTKHTRTGKVTVSANYQIVDVKTGRIVDSNSISRTISSTAQWVTYVGDEEALDSSVLAHNTTGDVSIHPPEILASDAIESISRTISAKILNYYNE